MLSVLLLVTGVVVTAAPSVMAIIGRPLTPVSVAGVARRSVRRNAAYNYYNAPAYVPAPAYAPAPAYVPVPVPVH